MSEAREDLSGVRLMVFGSCSVAVLGLPHILLWLKDRLRLRHIRVVLTPMATRLVTVDSIKRVAGCEVYVDWDDLPAGARSHVSLADWAQVALVLPATAGLVGKLAHGIADNLATSTLMALPCPVIVVPSTNATTWAKPVVRRNVQQLREDGFTVVEPQEGLAVAGETTEPGSMGDYRPALLQALVRAAQGPPQDRSGNNAKEYGGLT
ncbi:flavoprotein [Streptomyces sp. NPDC050703]|uniref:flavoprotein n=1 Tax=Streptomyces sp. NPDC050703 TaxID=3157218 RepID=UPI003419389A